MLGVGGGGGVNAKSAKLRTYHTLWYFPCGIYTIVEQIKPLWSTLWSVYSVLEYDTTEYYYKQYRPLMTCM